MLQFFTNNIPFIKQARTTTCIALAMFTVSVATPALAKTAQEKVDAVTDQEITTILENWIEEQANGCSLLITQALEKKIQTESKNAVFKKAGIAEAEQENIKQDLHERIGNVIENHIENGVWAVDRTDTGPEIKIKECASEHKKEDSASKPSE